MLDVGALIATLWRGKLLIFLAVTAAVVVGAYYAYLVATPQYRSTAVMMLNARAEGAVDFGSVAGALSAESSVVNTEVEVLKSRRLLANLVAELDLDKDPEFNRLIRQPSFLDQVKLRTKRQLGLTQPTPPPTEQDTLVRTREATIDGLLSKLTIRNIPQSLVFQVTAQTSEPGKSAAVANTLVDVYIRNQLDVKYESTKQATGRLTGRVSQLQVALQDAETAVKVFRAKTDLVSPETLVGLEAQLKEVRDRISDMKSADSAALQRIDAIKSMDDRSNLAKVLQDPQLSRLVPQLDSDLVIKAFDTRVAQISDRAELQLQRGVTQASALRASQQALQDEIARQSSDLITLQQLTREAEASRMLYEFFLARLKETSAQQGVHKADSRMLSHAVIPTFAASPNRPVIVTLSALIGLTFAAAYLLLREARIDTVRTAQALQDVSGYPVLGQLANLPARGHQKALSYMSQKPMSAAAEAMRNLRTSVLFSGGTETPQIVMTSSALPGEGKTTVALTLAQNIANMGKRVLLIEGDMRRSTVNEVFGKSKTAGLGSVIHDGVAFHDAVFNDPSSAIDVLSGGHSSMSSADLFSSDAFSALIKTARETYDHIVVDTPSVLIVPDARILAQHADAILLVVKWDATRTWQVKDALALFESANQHVSGLVLNQINPRQMRRYGEHSQHYDAGSVYGRNYYVN